MAFDETLAARVRETLAARRDVGEEVEEKRMFGGLAFMVRGHMCCGIIKEDLMLRLGLAQEEDALAEPHTRPMDFTKRPMRGFIYVEPEGTRAARDLARWTDRAVRHALTLPPKSAQRATPRRRQAR